MAFIAVACRVLFTICLGALLRFLYRGWQVRQFVRETARKHNTPLLPHSWIWGHLHVVRKTLARYPRDVNGQYAPLLLAMANPELRSTGVLYLDTWPVMPPMLAVFHPDMMAEFTQTTSLPKHPNLITEFMPFTHMNDLVTMSGQTWKMWRTIFNPAFSSKNLLSLVPGFLEEIDVFVEDLKRAAQSGEVIRLEDKATMCTIDIIGRAILDIRLHCQTTKNELQQAMKRQIALLWPTNAPGHLLVALNPFRPFRMWNNNRIIKNYLLPHIKRGIKENASGETTEHKTINSLATKAYLSMASLDKPNPKKIDSHFIDVIISQFKIFFFAGHDTTASTLSYIYHLLHQNPTALAKLRAEHDTVLGCDTSKARSQLAAFPTLLNQLPYTAAVIKETLRLFPPVGTIREGQPGFFLTHPETKKQYPTEGMMVFGVSFLMHRLDEFWPRATEFLPERWLARERDPLRPRKNAFRPFELGPRNCIGQELALIELRAILALTVREMEIESAYPAGSPAVLGDQAYQVMEAGMLTGHPKLGMPVRVKMRAAA